MERSTKLGKKNGYDSSSIFQNVDNSVPVSFNRIDNFSQRFIYDMEYYTRNPCEETEEYYELFSYSDTMNMTSITGKGALKKQRNVVFFTQNKFSRLVT